MENIYNPLVINKEKSIEERAADLLKKMDEYMLTDELHNEPLYQSKSTA